LNFEPIVAKVFLGGERKFIEPLMRFMRGNVRDQIVSSKSDHEPPQFPTSGAVISSAAGATRWLRSACGSAASGGAQGKVLVRAG
jgi:hypothetical protein